MLMIDLSGHGIPRITFMTGFSGVIPNAASRSCRAALMLARCGLSRGRVGRRSGRRARVGAARRWHDGHDEPRPVEANLARRDVRFAAKHASRHGHVRGACSGFQPGPSNPRRPSSTPRRRGHLRHGPALRHGAPCSVRDPLAAAQAPRAEVPGPPHARDRASLVVTLAAGLSRRRLPRVILHT